MTQRVPEVQESARALGRLRVLARVGGRDMEPVRRVLDRIDGPNLTSWREPWRTPEAEFRIEESRQRALKESPR